MSKNLYPKANATLQYFVKKFTGSTMVPNIVVLHTTEGFSWPGYGGGATAPNMTMLPDIKNKKLLSRQHYPANKSSRALENRPGGVQTNTQNAFQIELIGTCDSRYRKRWGSKVAGVDYIYWPDAPDWALKQLGEVIVWLNKDWEVPIKDAAPRGWVSYPASYGLTARQRMTFSEWNKGRGIVGHQHVPENSHGDPGNMNIKRMIELIKGSATPLPDPTKPVIDPKVVARITSMTYNVVAEVAHVGLAKFKIRVPYIVDFIEEAMPDVLHLEEAGDATVHKPLRDQLEDAGYRLLVLQNWRAIYYRASTVERKAGWKRGHLVLDGPVVDGVKDTKVAVYGLLQLKKEKIPFWAICTHLSHRDNEGAWRIKQIDQVRTLVKGTLKKSKNAPVILGADLNSSAQVANHLVSKGWVSGEKATKKVSWEYNTLNKLVNPPLKASDHIDHVLALAGGGLTPRPVRWEQYGNISKGLYQKPFPADHNPVLVEWELVKA